MITGPHRETSTPPRVTRYVEEACHVLLRQETRHLVFAPFSSLDDDEAQWLVSSFRANPSLETLTLEDVQTDKYIESILEQVMFHSKLHSLHFQNCSLNTSTSYSKFALSCRNLRNISLSRCSINDYAAHHISQALITNAKSLISLDLSVNNITVEGASAISLWLAQDSCVRRLVLDRNRLCAQGATELSKGLKSNTSLEYLELRANAIQEIGTCEIAKAASKHPRLGALGLEDNYIGETGIDNLMGAYTCNAALRSLELSWNNIESPSSMQRIATSIDCIQSLTLNYCEIDDTGIERLSSVLCTSLTLRDLSLEHNRFGCPGAESLALALPTTKLKHLYLSGNRITSKGALVLISAIRHNSSLQTLKLDPAYAAEQSAIDMELRLNMAGRAKLSNESCPLTLWSHFSANESNNTDSPLLTIQERPEFRN